MARGRATIPADEAPRLVGYRLLRGFVLFVGAGHRALVRGEFVPADDQIVPLLFRGGAALEQVME